MKIPFIEKDESLEGRDNINMPIDKLKNQYLVSIKSNVSGCTENPKKTYNSKTKKIDLTLIESPKREKAVNIPRSTGGIIGEGLAVIWKAKSLV